MKLIIRYAIFCVILAARLNQILALCCPTTAAKHYCSTWCCGQGACNIFCCNCGHGYSDGGCTNEYWRNYLKWHGHMGPEDGYIWQRDGLLPSYEGHLRSDGIYTLWKRSIGNETKDYFRERLLKDTKELFQAIDVDGDNFLTLEESEFYLKNYKGLKRSTSDHTLEREIMRIDINNDGMISPKEFDESL